ncbi:MAG TPA: hypothetical protein VF062_06130 [Candidatus Limnocylindrales bacterium]
MTLLCSSRWGILIAAWLLAASCTSGHAPPSNDGSKDGTVLTGLGSAGAGSGTIWLLAGPAPQSANIFRLTLSDRRVEQVTRNAQGHGISWLSASRAGIVVADASTGADRIGVLDTGGGRVTPLQTGDELTTTAYTPAISPDGAIAFARAMWPTGPPGGRRQASPASTSAVPGPGAKPVWEIVVTDPGRKNLTVAHQAEPALAAPAWGPRGGLAFIESPGVQGGDSHPKVYVLNGDRRPAGSFRAPLGKASSLLWGQNEGMPLAVTDGVGSTALLDTRDGSSRPLPNGWVGLCWNPTGDRLLVGQGSRLALVATTKPEEVIDVGRFGGGNLYGCGWIDR